MFLFTFQAIVKPGSEIAHDKKFKNVGGAYVNAWVNFKESEGAELLARFYIEDAGWIIERRTEQSKDTVQTLRTGLQTPSGKIIQIRGGSPGRFIRLSDKILERLYTCFLVSWNSIRQTEFSLELN
ncbi:MAG: hypothetical protein GY862_04320 [Gammaproteobacteria bacterium]|nr:hypothetical protein [Gammaproteobacteria bacterium]